MITVVIPVLNESGTVASVVGFARRHPLVTEILVVDDGSIDGTPEMARSAGATVLTSTMLGKGASLEDGVRAATNPVVLFLDGDLSGLHPELIDRMSRPFVEGDADLVKARFARSAGRVTTLTARPLLRLFFPELAHLEQPLGGIVAARRDVLQRLSFENDYGVDVGLLVDACTSGARIVEVDIGSLEHVPQPLDRLADMADQVTRTILDRAARLGRLSLQQLQEFADSDRQNPSELAVVAARLGHVERLALLDMDGVLLASRFVVELAEHTCRRDQLEPLLDHPTMPADERTRRIAALFAGVPRATFEHCARQLPLVPGAAETVIALRKAGFRVGIVTDSYHLAAETVRRRVFADFSISHVLRFRQGVATGELTLAPAMRHEQGCPRHTHCKRNVLQHLIETMRLDPEDVLAVGDGENDVCMLEQAGWSVAFEPKSPGVAAAARRIAREDLRQVIDAVNSSPTAGKIEFVESPLVRVDSLVSRSA